MAGEILTPGDLGRLKAYGSNAPATARVPIYDSATGKATYVTPAQLSGGAADVVGPSSATDTATVIFDGTTGKLVKNSGVYPSTTKRCSASVTANTTINYADITGLSFTIVPGTYEFRCFLPSTVASGTGGIKYCFNYTTAVLSSIESTARGFTASAVAVQHATTVNAQTDLFSQAAIVIFTELTGTMVVATGGIVDIQMAQSVSNSSNTITLLGSSAQFTRIS